VQYLCNMPENERGQRTPAPLHVDSTVPVLIVGGGPVGLCLALFLAYHGVRCVVFNGHPEVRADPRGSTHNARTMEHFRRLGLAAEIRALGLPPDHATDVAYYTRYNGFELARLPMPSTRQKLCTVAGSGMTDQSPEPLHRVNQMYVEPRLLQQARATPEITLKFGWRVTEVRQEDSHVAIRAEQVKDGIQENWRSSYVIGCDGGQSVVRTAMSAVYQGSSGFDQRILGGPAVAAHLQIPSLYTDFLTARRAWSYWALNEELAINLISLNGRDEFFLLSSSVKPDSAEVAGLVQRAVGAPVRVDVLGHRPWTPGLALVADRFGDGRLFLAGDAAHLFTPTGGFGLNTGIDDVANLSWKLAAMIRGWGGDRLLPSYEKERWPIAVRNTRAARQLNKNLGAIELGEALERIGPDGDAERERVRRMLSTYGEQFASIGVQLGARYDGSPIISGEDEQAPADSPTVYVPSAVPGGRTPHAWVTDRRNYGDSLYDRLGSGFTLLRMGTHPPQVQSICAAAQARGIPLTVLNVPQVAIRDLYQRDLALVRPDQHVAWRGNRLPHPDALLDLVCGR
jgi:2-polyprenyl-6-methoxyphenol hydroxylase-like FAD-dependent oxidoreductase